MQFKQPSIREGWPIAAGLLALSVIPVAAGVVRLVSLATGETVTLANARFLRTRCPSSCTSSAPACFASLAPCCSGPAFAAAFRAGTVWLGGSRRLRISSLVCLACG